MANEDFQVRDFRGRFLWLEKNALEIVSANLGPKGVSVYTWLCYYANSKSQGCFPSIKTLTEKTLIRRQTVISVIKRLEELRIIMVERTSGLTSEYTLLNVDSAPKDTSIPTDTSIPIGTGANPDTTTSANPDTTPVPIRIPEQQLFNNNKLTTKKELRSPQKVDTSPQGKFLDSFSMLYENQTGMPFKTDKKHFVVVSGLIKKYGYERLVEKAKLLAHYCQRGEVWFAREGWSCFTPETLSTHWNRIIPILSEEQKKTKKSEEIYQKLKEDRRKADELVKDSLAA